MGKILCYEVDCYRLRIFDLNNFENNFLIKYLRGTLISAKDFTTSGVKDWSDKDWSDKAGVSKWAVGANGVSGTKLFGGINGNGGGGNWAKRF